ncbi:transporter [Fimbriimonas ginsengisoli]|uniref:Transporter n=1 Tax=Fimbriimonas ginsengisoli Gsoil 348 TaxID=661478 RepID=A0A068NXC4_FIMGI|nr:transporter [Fimbriimonas ginsengisoli]AIE88178.1 hypothetical protein OP10G_4810 [Fimbriimonas ginsengisoli Gsoil 348]
MTPIVLSIATLTMIQGVAEKLDPISPDRPSFANATHIVPLNHPYLEVGIRQTAFGDSTTTDYGDGNTLRLALRENLEARIGFPSYLAARGDGASDTGFGDETVGFKWRLTPDAAGHRSAFAVEGDATFPSGSRAFRGARVQPVLTGIWTVLPDAHSELDVNLLVARPADDAGSFTEFGAAAAYGKDLGQGFGVYGELFCLLPQVGRVDRSAYVDAGVSKLLRDNLALDAYIGRGLNGVGRDHFFGAGVSYRF